MARLLTSLKSAFFACALTALSLNAASAAKNDEDPRRKEDPKALELAWTVETGSPINIAPLPAGDLVLTVPQGGPLLALDALTGKQKWTFAPKEGVWDRGFSVRGEQVFVCTEGGKMTALNRADGTHQWTTELGINCQRPSHFSGDTVYVSTTFVGPGLRPDILTGAKLFSINMADGSINWSFTSSEFLLQTATSLGDTVYVAGNYIDKNFTDDDGGPARYYALDKKTGTVKWIHVSIEGTPKALYATKDLLIFVAYQDFLYGLDTATGDVIWKRDSENWVPSLTGDGDRVFFGSATTYVYSWSIADGKEHWRYNIPGRKFDYLLIKPIVDGERLYFMSQRGYVYALDKNKGEEIWSYSTKMNSRVGISHSKGHFYMGDKDGRVYGYKILK